MTQRGGRRFSSVKLGQSTKSRGRDCVADDEARLQLARACNDSTSADGNDLPSTPEDVMSLRICLSAPDDWPGPQVNDPAEPYDQFRSGQFFYTEAKSVVVEKVVNCCNIRQWGLPKYDPPTFVSGNRSRRGLLEEGSSCVADLCKHVYVVLASDMTKPCRAMCSLSSALPQRCFEDAQCSVVVDGAEVWETVKAILRRKESVSATGSPVNRVSTVLVTHLRPIPQSVLGGAPNAKVTLPFSALELQFISSHQQAKALKTKQKTPVEFMQELSMIYMKKAMSSKHPGRRDLAARREICPSVRGFPDNSHHWEPKLGELSLPVQAALLTKCFEELYPSVDKVVHSDVVSAGLKGLHCFPEAAPHNLTVAERAECEKEEADVMVAANMRVGTVSLRKGLRILMNAIEGCPVLQSLIRAAYLVSPGPGKTAFLSLELLSYEKGIMSLRGDRMRSMAFLIVLKKFRQLQADGQESQLNKQRIMEICNKLRDVVDKLDLIWRVVNDDTISSEKIVLTKDRVDYFSVETFQGDGVDGKVNIPVSFASIFGKNGLESLADMAYTTLEKRVVNFGNGEVDRLRRNVKSSALFMSYLFHYVTGTAIYTKGSLRDVQVRDLIPITVGDSGESFEVTEKSKGALKRPRTRQGRSAPVGRGRFAIESKAQREEREKTAREARSSMRQKRQRIEQAEALERVEGGGVLAKATRVLSAAIRQGEDPYSVTKVQDAWKEDSKKVDRSYTPTPPSRNLSEISFGESGNAKTDSDSEESSATADEENVCGCEGHVLGNSAGIGCSDSAGFGAGGGGDRSGVEGEGGGGGEIRGDTGGPSETGANCGRIDCPPAEASAAALEGAIGLASLCSPLLDGPRDRAEGQVNAVSHTLPSDGTAPTVQNGVVGRESSDPIVQVDVENCDDSGCARLSLESFMARVDNLMVECAPSGEHAQGHLVPGRHENCGGREKTVMFESAMQYSRFLRVFYIEDWKEKAVRVAKFRITAGISACMERGGVYETDVQRKWKTQGGKEDHPLFDARLHSLIMQKYAFVLVAAVRIRGYIEMSAWHDYARDFCLRQKRTDEILSEREISVEDRPRLGVAHLFAFLRLARGHDRLGSKDLYSKTRRAFAGGDEVELRAWTDEMDVQFALESIAKTYARLFYRLPSGAPAAPIELTIPPVLSCEAAIPWLDAGERMGTAQSKVPSTGVVHFSRIRICDGVVSAKISDLATQTGAHDSLSNWKNVEHAFGSTSWRAMGLQFKAGGTEVALLQIDGTKPGVWHTPCLSSFDIDSLRISEAFNLLTGIDSEQLADLKGTQMGLTRLLRTGCEDLGEIKSQESSVSSAKSKAGCLEVVLFPCDAGVLLKAARILECSLPSRSDDVGSVVGVSLTLPLTTSCRSQPVQGLGSVGVSGRLEPVRRGGILLSPVPCDGVQVGTCIQWEGNPECATLSEAHGLPLPCDDLHKIIPVDTILPMVHDPLEGLSDNFYKPEGIEMFTSSFVLRNCVWDALPSGADRTLYMSDHLWAESSVSGESKGDFRSSMNWPVAAAHVAPSMTWVFAWRKTGL